MDSLRTICVKTFIDDGRKLGDDIIDNVSTDKTVRSPSQSTAVSKVDTTQLYSNKGKKRGMQRKKETPGYKSLEDLRSSSKTTLLSSISSVVDFTTIQVLLDNVRTVPQLLKVIDKMVIVLGSREFYKGLIFKTLQRVSPKHGFYPNRYLIKLCINDSLLFIETTPRALVFIRKKVPSRLKVVGYDGIIHEIYLEQASHENENHKSFDLQWTKCGRYICLFRNRLPCISFDMFSHRIISNERVLSHAEDYTREPVSFLTRMDAVYFNPSLTLKTEEDILDPRYRLRDSEVSSICVGLMSELLENHQKLNKIMGWYKFSE